MASQTGLVFPESKPGNRSTIQFQLKTFHHLLYDNESSRSDNQSENTKNNENLEKYLNKEGKSYRKGYREFFRKLNLACLESKEKALEIAEKGLDFIYENFEVLKSDNETCKKTFKEEMTTNTSTIFKTCTSSGENKADAKDSNAISYSVKYKGRSLKGDTLCDQLNKWAVKGVMERDAKKALISVATAGNMLDENILNLEELSENCFILIGAGSAMGPFETLISMGAIVVAIDIPRTDIWERLISRTKKSRSGKMIYPIIERDGEQIAGCDLLTQTAEILNWLKTLPVLKTMKVTIGNYTYLDGAKHVLLSVAADGIINGLCQELEGKLNVAFLCTPTDISVVPQECYYSSRERLYSIYPGKLVETLIRFFSFGTQLDENNIKPFGKHYVYDGLVVAQGPNYAFAKTIQQWRAIKHYCSYPESKLSLNVAPATNTLSVVHNKTFKMAFSGMPYFSPMEVFYAETSSSLMAGLLIHDILGKDKYEPELNPLVIKSRNAVHGGAWRCAYSQDTLGFTSVLVHILGGKNMFLCFFYLLLLLPIIFMLWFFN